MTVLRMGPGPDSVQLLFGSELPGPSAAVFHQRFHNGHMIQFSLDLFCIELGRHRNLLLRQMNSFFRNYSFFPVFSERGKSGQIMEI